MNNLIMQHWSGEMNELAKCSMENISQYAEDINVKYVRLDGDLFGPGLNGPLQKLYMLNEEFDDYDCIMMIDMDAFFPKNKRRRNIFTEEVGIGRYTNIQRGLRQYLCKTRKYKERSRIDAPYWGGSIYRIERETRQKLRVHLDKAMPFEDYKPHCQDEGVMHCLANFAGMKHSPELYLDSKWNISSYEPNVKEGYTIHIRTKITPKGPKRTKMENYLELVDKGII